MKKLSLLLTMSLLACWNYRLPAQMVVNTGNHRIFHGPSTAAQIRCSRSSSINGAAGATQTFSLPTCAAAGDLVVMFIGSSAGVTTSPSGWAIIQGNSLTGPANWGGMALSKILVSSDVSTGTVSVTFNTSTPSACVMFAEFIGTTGGTSMVDAVFAQNSAFTSAGAGNSTTYYNAGDVLLNFTSGRNNGPISLTSATTLETQTNSANSAAMGIDTETSSGSQTSVGGTFGTWNPSGVYTIVLTVRGGSFTPESIPGLEFGFDAACITRTTSTCAVPSTGTTLSTWFNNAGALKSGSGSSASNNNGSFTANGTCTFNTSQINGQPAVTFNGSTCFIGSMSADPTQASGFTGVLVAKLNAIASKSTVFGGPVNSPAYWLGPSKEQGNDKQNISNTGTGTAAGDTNWHQMNFTYVNNSGFPSYRLDRATDTTINGTTSSWTNNPTAFGRNNATSNEWTNGQIAGAWWYNRTLRSDEITLLESYLNTRFGL